MENLAVRLDLDGINDYVEISDPGTGSVLDFDDGEDITISFWTNLDSFDSEDGYSNWINKGLATDSGRANYGIQTNSSNNVSFFYRNSADTAWNIYNTDSTYTLSEWKYVAVSYTFGTSSSMRIYFDGVLQEGDWDTGTGNDAPRVNDHEIWIGANDYGDGGDVDERIDGRIDQMMIYDYARTPAQVAWDFNKGKPIAHWKMNDGSGTTVSDESGNGNNGTMTNMDPATDWVDGKFGRCTGF